MLENDVDLFINCFRPVCNESYFLSHTCCGGCSPLLASFIYTEFATGCCVTRDCVTCVCGGKDFCFAFAFAAGYTYPVQVIC